MLFNTLAFAKFFVVVFLVAWLLVNRRTALLLPWIAVGGFVAFTPPHLASYAVTAAALGLTLLLCRLHRAGDRPPVRLAVMSTNSVPSR